MRITFEPRFNDKVLIKCEQRSIVRTQQDFKTLESHLIGEPSVLLVPRVPGGDYLRWIERLIEYNGDISTDPTLERFLTDEAFFLVRPENEAKKSLFRYMGKLENFWRGTGGYHKWAYQRG